MRHIYHRDPKLVAHAPEGWHHPPPPGEIDGSERLVEQQEFRGPASWRKFGCELVIKR